MIGEKSTKTVVRMLMPWNDEKEERWLAEQERSGWHLKAVRGFGYTFERASPADVAYRLDFHAGHRSDLQEYLALFKDSGWEHAGTLGHWHYFRQGVVDGKVPEIYTDPESRVAKYKRVIALMGVMLVILAAVIATKWPVAGGAEDRWRLVDKFYASAFFLKLAAMAFLLYAIAKLARLIHRLEKQKA